MDGDGTQVPGPEEVHPQSNFVTSSLGAFPCHPPVTLSLPPTTDARAESSDRGRAAREIQADAWGESKVKPKRKRKKKGSCLGRKRQHGGKKVPRSSSINPSTDNKCLDV